MERFFVCVNGHSFRVFDEGDDPPADTPEVYFGVTCPSCGSIYEIRWPSNRAFRVLAT
jgi:hypothetical protein